MKLDEMDVAPLRSLDDFLLGSARFQLPNFKDVDKWGNRVVQNLYYYQTNYFAMAISMWLIFILINPLKMILGALCIGLMCGLFYYLVNTNSLAMRMNRNHPHMGVLLIIMGACLIVHLLGLFLVFLCGILPPVTAVFIHASFRLRNIKNKLSNFEKAVSKKTPMALLLDSLHLEEDLLS